MKRKWAYLCIAAVLNAALLGSASAAAPPQSTAGSAIGQDTYDAQKALADAFHNAHCPKAPCPPNTMTTPTTAEVLKFTIDMAKAEGWSTVAHAPGYLGTTTTAPDVAPGVDEPVPSTIMQVTSGGAFVGVWWKKGPGATDWVKLVSGNAGSISVTAPLSIRASTDTTTATSTGPVPVAADPVISAPTDLVSTTSTIGATDGLALRTGTSTSTQSSAAIGDGPVVIPVYGSTVQPLGTDSATGTTKQPSDSGHKHALPTDLVRTTDTRLGTDTIRGSLTAGKVPVATGPQALADSLISQNTTSSNVSVAGDFGVGAVPSADGWNRTLRLNGASTARLILTTDDASVVGGLFQHTGWMGAALLSGTVSNHPFGIVVNNALAGAWSTSGLGVGIAGPENAEGWQRALEVHGTDNAKLQLTTATGGILGGQWAASLPFISGAGYYLGTRSNHAVYLITNGALRLTLGTDGSAAFTGAISAANISTTPTASYIPKAYTDHTIDDGWIKSSIARTTDTRFGIATNLATTASPVNTATWGGVSTEASRGDHIHAHGAQPIGDGTNHAAVSASYNGFATPAILAASTNADTGTGTTGYIPQWLGLRYLGDSQIAANTTAAAVAIGTTPTNPDGWNRSLEVYGTNHSRLLLSTNSIVGGAWSNNGGAFGGGAGYYTGTTSAHPYYLIAGGSIYATFNSGVAAFQMAISAPNISGTPSAYKIPWADASGTLNAWITNDVTTAGLTPTYLPIASGSRVLVDGPLRLYSGIVYGDSVGLSLGGTISASNISDGAAPAIVVKTDSGGHLNGGIIPYGAAMPPSAFQTHTPGPGSSYYTARENHTHPPVPQVSWAGGPSYTSWYIVPTSTAVVIEWPVELTGVGPTAIAGEDFEYYCDSVSTCAVYYEVWVGGNPHACNGVFLNNATENIDAYSYRWWNTVSNTFSRTTAYGVKVCARATFDETGGYLYLKGAHIALTTN